jgi:hypothetical protein
MGDIRSSIQSLAQELAEAASRQARAPGSDRALRVGRQRRRRRRAGGVALLTLALVAGTAGLPRLHLLTGAPAGLPQGAAASTSSQALSPVVCDPGRPPKGTGTTVATGTSQGIAWRVTLKERKNPTPLSPQLSEQERAVMQNLRKQGLDQGYAVLQLHVGAQNGGGLNTPIPTSGATGAGKVVDTAAGPMRPLLGFVGTPQNTETGVRVRYQDPPGAVEACFVPTAERLKLHGRLFVAFIPAAAKWPKLEYFDAHGKFVGEGDLGCSLPPTDLMPPCPTRRAPADVRRGTSGQNAQDPTTTSRDGG